MSDSQGTIIPVSIEDEMSGAYIDYSMSVIISRALPDVRDGLKPVHRRILYGMSELGLGHNRSYKKSARIVGEVLGKYHPHGDSAVYDTMVRMAQNWSLRYPLVDGQGNFGSVDGDNPAAMRYTEARMKRIAEEMLSDIEKNVVAFQPNFDDSLQEPTVMPAKVPNLLINGTSGIAVGMATNMAPHNLTEVINGIHAYIDNPEITISELMKYITAPDFPTGGIIYGYQGVRSAFETGRGRIVVRAVSRIEENEKTGKTQIIISELPYQVNKANLIEKTAALVNEKKIEGITNIRDESDRDGLRIVFDLRKDAIPTIVLNNLFIHTALQTSFSVNNVALVHGRPMTLNLKDMILHYVNHRHEVVVKRSQYDLDEAQKRAHILEGLLKALDSIDEIIALIRKSKDGEEARNGLISQFDFSEVQAKAILEMRLQRLTGLERDKLQGEYNETMKTIEYLTLVLGDHGLRMQIIKDELTELKDRYGDERRTQIMHSSSDIGIEDILPDDEMVITLSNQGYIKRTPLTEYKAQGRGGIGARGVSTKEDDFTELMFVATTHDYLLIFTDPGRLYWLKVYGIPEGGKISKGRPIQNLIQIDKEEKVRAILNVRNLNDSDYVENTYLFFCTEKGIIKKTTLESFSRPRSSGINAITINEGDKLLDVKLTTGDNQIILATRSGRAIRFPETDVRAMGRSAAGVKGVTLDEEGDDRVIGLVSLDNQEAELLVVSEKGYGKRSNVEDYRIIHRGGKGVITLNITDKTGALVSIKEVTDADDLMIVKKSGITIRLHVKDLRVVGRNTQGVRLVKVNEDDEISSVAKITEVEGEEPETPIENTEE